MYYVNFILTFYAKNIWIWKILSYFPLNYIFQTIITTHSWSNWFKYNPPPLSSTLSSTPILQEKWKDKWASESVQICIDLIKISIQTALVNFSLFYLFFFRDFITNKQLYCYPSLYLFERFFVSCLHP